MGEAQFGSGNTQYYSHHKDLSAWLLETQPYFLAFYFLTWLRLKVVRHTKLKQDHGNLPSPRGILCEFPILELSIFVSPYALSSTGAEQSLGYGKHGKHLWGSEVHTAPITHPGAEIALSNKCWVQWQTFPHWDFIRYPTDNNTYRKGYYGYYNGLEGVSLFTLLFALAKNGFWAYLLFGSVAAFYVNDSTPNFLLHYGSENNTLQLELPEKCHLLLWFRSSMENAESLFFFLVSFPRRRVKFCDRKIKQRNTVKNLTTHCQVVFKQNETPRLPGSVLCRAAFCMHHDGRRKLKEWWLLLFSFNWK